MRAQDGNCSIIRTNPIMEPNNKLPPSFTFSQSSLQDYVDCPRRFQLRYIEKLNWPAVETEPVLENERRQQEGQLFHRLVQQHILGLPVEILSKRANSPDLARWWENYLNSDFDLTNHTCLTELTLSAVIGENRLIAKYDLVTVRPDGTALIIDWKTYHKRPRNEWMVARLQTRVYRSLLVFAGVYLNKGIPFEADKVQMTYWYPEYPTEPARFPYNTNQYKRDWDAITSLISEIRNHQHFHLTEDEKKCAYCPYRSYCNRGVKAGNSEDITEEDVTLAEINLEQVAEIEY